MDQATATLLAASIAAGLSVVNLVWNSALERRGEFRAQYRALLQPYIGDIGEALHEIQACATVVPKRRDPGAWLENSRAAAERLDRLRIKTKYALGDVEDGLREMTRFPSWLGHCIKDQERRDKMIRAAEDLRVALDTAIRAAYLHGRPPAVLARWRVRCKTTALRKIWDEGPPAEEDFAQDAPSA